MMLLMQFIAGKERRGNYSTGKLRLSRELRCSEEVISVPTRKGNDVVSLMEQVGNITIIEWCNNIVVQGVINNSSETQKEHGKETDKVIKTRQ